MGLDMYLYRKQYARPESKEVLKIVRKGKPTIVTPEWPTMLREEIGYWRKANHIHGWFVDNVQDGKDDCREYDVERHQLASLYQTIQEVLDASKLVPGKVSVGQTLQGGKWEDILRNGKVIEDPEVAQRRLPRREGFFFGAYGYDEEYVQDLRDTLKILEVAFASSLHVDLSYRASW